jgi:hypothetical protein
MLLRGRFWANNFESDQTLENPEPKLAPLPSSQVVSSEIELLQRSSSCFTGQISDPLCGVRCVLGMCVFVGMFITSPDLGHSPSLTRLVMCIFPLLNP